MWIRINYGHEYPVRPSAAGVKKLIGAVADGSVMKALKQYLYMMNYVNELVIFFGYNLLKGFFFKLNIV